MYKAKYLDLISNELAETNSLGALSIMINAGSEVDFTIQDRSYSITRLNGKLKLEEKDTGEKQLFDNVSELIMKGNINGQRFIDAWKNAQVDFIY